MGGQDCKATERFSNRVENYIRYRPHYPVEIIELLKADCGLKPEAVVADVGSGTGFLAEIFLANYERLLLTYATDYEKVNHKRIDTAVLREFFRVEPIKKVIPTYQHLDFAALKGRLLSSSYVPEAGQADYDEMLSALKDLFD